MPAAARARSRRGPTVAATLVLVALAGIAGGWALDQALASFRYTLPEELEKEASLEPLAIPEPPAAPRPLAPEVASLPQYPGAEFAPIAESVVAQGLPMSLAYGITLDPPDKVVDFYAQELTRQGLSPVAHMYGPMAGFVGYKEKETGLMRTVSVLGQGGQTMIYLSSSKPESLASVRAEVPAALPQPADATEVVAVKLEEGKVLQHSVSALVKGKTVADVAEYYRGAFVQGGWTVQTRGLTETEGRVEASRPKETATVVLRKKGPADGAGVSVFVTYLKQGS